MLNKVKTKALISVGAVAATSFILMMGYTAGQHSTAKQSRKEIELAATKLVEDKQAEDKASILSSDTVKEFLTQYYTKEKLGENNTRIQPYMTESAYSQELSSQNDAMNQVYKDYILDYHFEKADIFVNQTTNQAIAMVSYNVTMKNLKEENMRRALSHIERHKQAINTSNNSEDNDFHKLLLQFSYEVYERIKANKKPYPNLNSDKVF